MKEQKKEAIKGFVLWVIVALLVIANGFQTVVVSRNVS
jgi:hypothetical protein